MGIVANVFSSAPDGFSGKLVEVECDATKGLPCLQIVGLANKSIDEAKERVKSAITNSLLTYPPKRITVNLAPAELPKDGTHYDLPIAIAILVSSGQLKAYETKNALFIGELALDGAIRPVNSAIIAAEVARDHSIETIYVPHQNIVQASLIAGVTVIGVTTLKALFLHLKGEQKITPPAVTATSAPPVRDHPLLDDIKGQDQAKRALIIAAAGRHNILLSGPPGSGKSMLGKVLPHILPALTRDEQLAVTKLHSLQGECIDELIHERPFRAPHHTTSRTSLIGGGTKPKPGEVSLAHLGVLFLDELPEYPRSTLEALRQPLEDRLIAISRANGKAQYPADFMLVATMNPCPCGFYGDPTKECTCGIVQIQNYQKKLSGPLLDRIDLKVSVSRVDHADLLSEASSSSTQHKSAYASIQSVHHLQHTRYGSSGKYNSSLSNRELKLFAPLDTVCSQLLLKASERLELSARATFRTIKIARTIADLDGSEHIQQHHLSEALQYR